MQDPNSPDALREAYTEVNSRTWDSWVEEGIEWGKPVSAETVQEAREGRWDIYLTPCIPVPHQWFPPLQDARVLGLASGGGQQMPILSVLGARCTVLDNSRRQLDSERLVADREGYAIDLVKADMTKPLPFADNTFDLIFHPVSNCYIEEGRALWKECFRVLKPGGVLLAGMDNGMNFLFAADQQPLVVCNPLPFNPLKDPELYRQGVEAGDGVQFSHTLEEQIGGQLEVGFRLTHVYEDRNPQGEICRYVPQYWASRAMKE